MEIPSRYVQSPKSKQVFHLILLNFGQYRTSKCIFFDIFQTQEMSKLSIISKIEFTQNSNYPFSGHLLNLTKRNYVIPWLKWKEAGKLTLLSFWGTPFLRFWPKKSGKLILTALWMLDARLAWMAEGNCFCLHSFSAVCLQFFLSYSSYSLYNGKKNVNAKRTKIFGMYTYLVIVMGWTPFYRTSN